MMNTEEKIKQIFKANIEKDVSDDLLESDQPIKDMSFLDSLAILNIMVALEKEFNVSFELESMDETFANITSIVNYINSYKK